MKLNKNRLIVAILLFIIILVGFINFTFKQKIEDSKKVGKQDEYYPNVEKEIVDINKYFIYGRSLYIEGIFNNKFNKDNIKDVSLVLKTNLETIPFKLIYEVAKDKILFKNSNFINDGIILDDIEVGNYYLLLKITTNKEDKYYTFNNKTKYNNLEYYTITRNKQNNYINIVFETANKKSFMNINVINRELPDDVYDIVIDPGHGGIDSGADYKDRIEEPINLAVSNKIKKELEDIGLKVKLTRDGNYNPGMKSSSDQYGAGGRVAIPHEVKAKYILSIHINSGDKDLALSGLEIYAGSRSKLDLAKSLVSNIISNTRIEVSNNPLFKEDEGIYVRTLMSGDISDMIDDAKRNNFAMYDITPNTPYYYMIRETGGIATSAYVDGRNPRYSSNPYYNSNIGIETYIIELGYIYDDNDYKIIIDDQDGYAKGIADAIKTYLLLD